MTTLADVTREDFQRAVGSAFVVEEPPVALRLVEVSEVRSSAYNESFAIVFCGGSDTPLPQSTYRLAHDELADLDVFLVPVGQTTAGVYYEAIFNRLLRTPFAAFEEAPGGDGADT